jgi:hypothetical protein
MEKNDMASTQNVRWFGEEKLQMNVTCHSMNVSASKE